MKLTNDIPTGYYFIWYGTRLPDGSVRWSSDRPEVIRITDPTTYRRSKVRLVVQLCAGGGGSTPIGKYFLWEIQNQAVYELSHIPTPTRPV